MDKCVKEDGEERAGGAVHGALDDGDNLGHVDNYIARDGVFGNVLKDGYTSN